MAAVGPLRAVAAAEEVVVAEVAVAEGAEEVVVVVGDLPQPLAPPRMAMEDQTGASKAIPPLFLMGTDPKVSNS